MDTANIHDAVRFLMDRAADEDKAGGDGASLRRAARTMAHDVLVRILEDAAAWKLMKTVGDTDAMALLDQLQVARLASRVIPNP